jgi:spermidine synthase
MPIILWSAFGVFSQLALVRLFSTTAGETTYYGNVFFIVAIFALSCGFFARKLARFYWLLPLAILLNYATVRWLGTYNLLQQLPGEFQWVSVANLNPKEANFDLQLAVLLLCTVLVPVMVLIGAKQGAHMVDGNYQKRGYVLMAVGGILGALVFTLQNQFFPSQWILFFLWTAGFLVILWREQRLAPNRRGLSVALLSAAVLLALGWSFSSQHDWSPYQRVDLRENRAEDTLELYTNGFYISTIHLQDADALHQDPLWTLHTTPFQSVEPGDRVLVLGSGGGTADVREAIYHHAGSIAAVEIDPKFIALGTKYDPDQSYLKPQVTTYVNDARRFLNTSQGKYDFIYMPFLDSQTNASNQSRFRLDSFLYTKEGLHLAYSKLSDRGVFFVGFATATPWIRQRMFRLLQEATQAEVRAFDVPGYIQTYYVVSHGRTVNSFPAPFVDATQQFATDTKELVPTDDWPFLYSQFAGIPKEHLRLIYTACILMLGIFLLCRDLSPASTASDRPAPSALCVYAFFSGAAFFFIQIRTISALTPWFGATYISQAMVVMGIILSSLGGALLAFRYRALTTGLAWALLFASVALGFFAADLFHPLYGTLFPSVTCFLLVLLLPTFFAGYVYLQYLHGLSSQAVLQMQLWNLVGGALGGLAEGAVIITGFRNSLWLVTAFYALAFLAAHLRTPKPEKNVLPVKAAARA